LEFFISFNPILFFPFNIILNFVYINKISLKEMVQEIIVGIIGFAVAALIISRVYAFFFSHKSQKGSCGCSSCGCSTKAKSIKS